MFLAAEVLIEGETVLLASGALIEEVKVIPGSGMLDEMERMVLSSVVLVGSWCSSRA
jgi:hypothetical protein